MITMEVLAHVFQDCPRARLEHFVAPLQSACEAAEINTRPRVAAFLAQAAHESRQLMVLEENLNYSADGLLRTFGSHFDVATAADYARQPELIANRVYANKGGNDDEASGDGWRYRGRGIFQVTLKDNYRTCSIAICGDADTLLINPEFLADPDYACISAAWYWGENGLNRWADIGDFDTLTKQINHAKLGLPERVAFWKRGLEALA
jgi:putative chitinase